jgi:hypothetical protein
MAGTLVTKTLLNFRESAVPVLESTENLRIEEELPYPKTWVREYRATIQVLHEGPTYEVNEESKVLRASIGNVYANNAFPPFFGPIRIDPETFFDYSDLNPTIPDSAVTMLTEASVNYSKEDHGKMQAVYTIEVVCPSEYWDAVAAVWVQIGDQEPDDPEV